jgi:hypothetical protein
LVEITLTLTNLGHPQQSHPLLFIDNECAIGLATSSVRPKKSKSIDAFRLDEGEGESTILRSCLPSRPHQPRQLLHQNASCLPPHSNTPFPSRHSLSPSNFTPVCASLPPHHNPSPSPPSVQSQPCSQRQGSSSPILPLTSPPSYLSPVVAHRHRF